MSPLLGRQGTAGSSYPSSAPGGVPGQPAPTQIGSRHCYLEESSCQRSLFGCALLPFPQDEYFKGPEVITLGREPKRFLSIKFVTRLK